MKLSPRRANTHNKICCLRTDHKSTEDHWILVEENTVSIANQKSCEKSEGMLTIDKKQFNSIIDWYNRQQKCPRNLHDI